MLERIKRGAIRLLVYPTLAVNLLMCAVGLWRRWDWIDDHVLLGGRPFRRDIAGLRGIDIEAIVNLCREFRGHPATLAEHGIEQLHLPTLDYHSPAADDLIRGVRFIQRHVANNRKVYLHCKAGRGRSAMLAVCYLMAADGLSGEAAERQVRAARPQVDRGLARRAVVVEIQARLTLETSERGR